MSGAMSGAGASLAAVGNDAGASISSWWSRAKAAVVAKTTTATTTTTQPAPSAPTATPAHGIGSGAAAAEDTNSNVVAAGAVDEKTTPADATKKTSE